MTRLLQLTEAEFEDFSFRSICDYAEDMTKCSDWTMPAALSKATTFFRKLLPYGVNTPNHHLFSIHAGSNAHAVGNVWIQTNKHDESAFLFDIYIYPAYRGCGHAHCALLAVEDYVRTLGLSTIRLHVFGHKQAARNLYDKLGFSVSHVTMTKHL